MPSSRSGKARSASARHIEFRNWSMRCMHTITEVGGRQRGFSEANLHSPFATSTVKKKNNHTYVRAHVCFACCLDRHRFNSTNNAVVAFMSSCATGDTLGHVNPGVCISARSHRRTLLVFVESNTSKAGREREGDALLIPPEIQKNVRFELAEEPSECVSTFNVSYCVGATYRSVHENRISTLLHNPLFRTRIV